MGSTRTGLTGYGSHKLLGDVQTSGVLIAYQTLFARSGTLQIATNTVGTGNGQVRAIDYTASSLSGSSVTISAVLPYPALIVSITARVTTTITGATTWDLGVTGNTQAYGAGLALSSGTTSTIARLLESNVAMDIVLTANGSAFTGGDVHLCIVALAVSAPSS